ncbi:hypothetical protein [Burkholderia multivorans]|uniref:hypothetical protein n=1 Tax=Burkholderia multivorans TaxID=87883 RepID=UPI001C25253B|nr:hypothetical protein [Burkholderia multivorans]MBU9552825.1 hypothetical protein [Burkholderia multivorans]
MPNYGYGGFLYGRGLYGENRTQSGTVASQWAETGSATAQRTPKVNMQAQAWVWRSTSADSAIQSGEFKTAWSVDSKATAGITSAGVARHPATWKTTVDGFGAHAGTVGGTWTATDKVVGSLNAASPVTSNATSSSSIRAVIILYGDVRSNWIETDEAIGFAMACGIAYSFYINYHNATAAITASGVENSNWKETSKRVGSLNAFQKTTSYWESDSKSAGRQLWEKQPDPPNPFWKPIHV